jgi:glycine/D-amino acid oxidase-like deaminating enzyme
MGCPCNTKLPLPTRSRHTESPPPEPRYRCRRDRPDVEWEDDAPVPFPYHGGVWLRDQAQFDPVPFLQSLVVELETHGGRLIPGARVRSVAGRAGDLRLQVQLKDPDTITVTAQQLVLATGIPILDRGGFFARVKPQRSYCVTYTVPGDLTRGMYICTDSPTRSVRYAPTADGEVLIVGGAGHRSAARRTRRARSRSCRSGRRLHYPAAIQTHLWSAQDYPHDLTMHRAGNTSPIVS